MAARPPSTRFPKVIRGTARPAIRNPLTVDPESRNTCTRGCPPGASATMNYRRPQIEGRRVEQPSRFRANRNQLASALESCGSDEDRVGAPIEDEVVAARRLLAGGELLKAAGDVCGERRDRRQRLDLRPLRRGRESSDTTAQDSHREKRRPPEDAGSNGHGAAARFTLRGGQYRATSLTAFSTSAACGRISSSRSG